MRLINFFKSFIGLDALLKWVNEIQWRAFFKTFTKNALIVLGCVILTNILGILEVNYGNADHRFYKDYVNAFFEMFNSWPNFFEMLLCVFMTSCIGIFAIIVIVICIMILLCCLFLIFIILVIICTTPFELIKRAKRCWAASKKVLDEKKYR